METTAKARKIGGSIGIIIPEDVIRRENIDVEDTLKIKVEKLDNLDFLFGRIKDIKTPAQKIIDVIDEGEDEYFLFF